MTLPYHLPEDIETRSMLIISEELGETDLSEPELIILKRVIHASADFDYARNLVFQNHAVAAGLHALRAKATIVTDTTMALSGISKPTASRLGISLQCYIGDPEVARLAKEQGTTRSVASANLLPITPGPLIAVVGNAPTALIRIAELIEAGELSPALVIGVPVGFVNVVESKELIQSTGIPCIVARGRKGGSNVAAAIVNALMYQLDRV